VCIRHKKSKSHPLPGSETIRRHGQTLLSEEDSDPTGIEQLVADEGLFLKRFPVYAGMSGVIVNTPRFISHRQHVYDQNNRYTIVDIPAGRLSSNLQQYQFCKQYDSLHN